MDRREILERVKREELSVEEASKLLEQLDQGRRLYCKVSPKGAVSLYGLQRMPVTLYAEQWERLLEFSEELRKFIAEHAPELKRKER